MRPNLPIPCEAPVIAATLSSAPMLPLFQAKRDVDESQHKRSPCFSSWRRFSPLNRDCPITHYDMIAISNILDLPRFRGVLSVWDQTI